MSFAEFAVISEDPALSADDVKAWAAACDAQLRLHFAPLYGRLPIPVVFYDKRADVPATSFLFVFVPQSAMDQPDAIAYHVQQDDRVSGLICAELATANGQHPAIALGHELLEAAKDPFCTSEVLTPSGHIDDDEIVDPVQDKSYAGPDGIPLADFVTPAWFDSECTAPADTPGTTGYSFAGNLPAAFSKTDGGYISGIDATGARFEHGTKPDWRKRCSVRGHKRAKHHAKREAAQLDVLDALLRASPSELVTMPREDAERLHHLDEMFKAGLVTISPLEPSTEPCPRCGHVGDCRLAHLEMDRVEAQEMSAKIKATAQAQFDHYVESGIINPAAQLQEMAVVVDDEKDPADAPLDGDEATQ